MKKIGDKLQQYEMISSANKIQIKQYTETDVSSVN